MKRGVQTHKMMLQDASAEMVIHRARKRQATQLTLSPKPVEVKASTPPQDGKVDGRKSGPWKLFVRDETLGHVGRPDLSDLGHRYNQQKELDPVTHAALAERAKRLSLPPGLCDGSKTSFGLNQGARRKAVRQAAVQASLSWRDASALVQGSHMDHTALVHQAVQSAVSRGASKTVTEIIKDVRSQTLAIAKETTAHRHIRAEQLGKWMEDRRDRYIGFMRRIHK